MSIVTIRTALETHLNALTPSLSTAWESVPFTPVTSTPYQQVNLLPSDTLNPTIGDNHYREKGIFQVTLCYPSNVGVKTITTRADLLCAWFKRGTSLNGVLIYKTPSKSQAMADGDRIRLAVSIHWQYDNFS